MSRISDESYRSLLARVDELVSAFEQHQDQRTRELAIALLTGLDAIHREALQRMIGRIHDFAGAELLERLTADPVVETLLGLYGLAELDLPPEPAPLEPGTGFVPIEQLTVGRPAGADRQPEGEPE